MAQEWYCARTKPLLETTAERRLQDQGFTTYLPRLTCRKPLKGRMVERREPLFRSYIFVQLDIGFGSGEIWRQVNSTKAVQSLLPYSDSPEAINHIEIEKLQDAEGQGFFRSGIIIPGDKIKVFRGTLVDKVLECIETRRNTVVALWACFGSQRRVVLRLSDVGVYA